MAEPYRVQRRAATGYGGIVPSAISVRIRQALARLIRREERAVERGHLARTEIA